MSTFYLYTKDRIMKIRQLLVGICLLLAGILLGNKLSDTKSQQFQVQVTDNQIDSHDNSVEDPSTMVTEEEGIKRKTKAFQGFRSNEQAVIDLFESAAPSVVFITTTSLSRSRWSMDLTEIPKGTGTGFMWDNSGHIVTNFHVLDGGNKFTVTLSDQSNFDAEVVGYEPSKDLAVLRIKAPSRKIKALPVGTSRDLRVGQFTYAIGNKIYDVIQTDAAINPGNSGGPLLDSSGRLIGVNTAIYSPSGAYSGIGFSIPVDVVNIVVPDLIKYGEVNRPLIGIELVNQSYVKEPGAMISKILNGGPAMKAGLKGLSRNSNGAVLPGDLIKAIDENQINSNIDLIETLDKYKPGENVVITFDRKGRLYEVELTLISSVK